MLTLLHGDDEIAIQKELSRIVSDATQKDIQTSRVEAKGLTFADLESILGTQELFSIEKLVVIDRLHGLLKSKAKDELIDLVATHANGEVSIVLVENKVLTVTMLKKFPSAKVMVFKLPMLLFSFVDSLGVQASPRLVTTFHQIIKTQESEFVFAMIMRQIRMLIAYVSDGSYTGSPFGRNKIVSQASHFSLPKLLRTHKELLSIDIGQKTSSSSLSLTQQIDLLLLGI